MTFVRRSVVGVSAVIACAIGGVGVAGAAPLPILPGNGSLGRPLLDKPALDKSFNSMQTRLAKQVPGRVGLALTPVGGGTTIAFGKVTTARAWSTLKVPVSLAAQRKNGSAVSGLETKAITLSDNDAAAALWDSLGSSSQAVNAVTSVLREGGDQTTRVSSEVDSPPSYPGATPWSVRKQSTFAANLPCLPGSSQILRLMGSVASNQQWGMAKKSAPTVRAAVKGGWGPVSDATGKYVVRQLAVIRAPGGRIGVSLVALPTSGSFTDGQRMLNTVATWVIRNLSKFPSGTCGPQIPASRTDEVAPAAQSEVAPAATGQPSESAPTATTPTATTPAVPSAAPQPAKAPTRGVVNVNRK